MHVKRIHWVSWKEQKYKYLSATICYKNGMAYVFAMVERNGSTIAQYLQLFMGLREFWYDTSFSQQAELCNRRPSAQFLNLLRHDNGGYKIPHSLC